MPLDYFPPDVYNSFSANLRRKLTGNEPHIALPPASMYDIFSSKGTWCKMSHRQKMKAYGNTKLALYDIPSLEDEDEEDEDKGESYSVELPDDDVSEEMNISDDEFEGIAGKRNAFV
jgi:hypothetical protein